MTRVFLVFKTNDAKTYKELEDEIDLGNSDNKWYFEIKQEELSILFEGKILSGNTLFNSREIFFENLQI